MGRELNGGGKVFVGGLQIAPRVSYHPKIIVRLRIFVVYFERFLCVQQAEEKKKAPLFKPAWEIGETVRVVAGPFADFNGIIEDMDIDQQKVTVLVNIFGRDTPVELGFGDIQKQ